LKLALVHDLAECIVGDITPLCGVDPAEKHQREDAAMKELAQLAGSCGSELYRLYKVKVPSQTHSTYTYGRAKFYGVEERKHMFFEWLVLDKGGVDDVGLEPADSSDNAVSVAMVHWNVQHCVFAIEQFLQHVIARFGDVYWPPGSPDLSICDFFLWGYLKCRVYSNRPLTIEGLKLSIRQEIAAVLQKMLERAMQDFEERLQMCVRQEGL